MQSDIEYQYYVNTINLFIGTLNNNAAYLNNINNIISNIFSRMDDAYTDRLNETSYMPINNNRRRRLNMETRPVTPIPFTYQPNPAPAETIPETIAETIPETIAETITEALIDTPSESQQPSMDQIYIAMSVINLTDVISRNITKMKYCDVINPTETSCAITQEEFKDDDIVGVFNNCKHIFNYHAIINWLVREQSCPCCRSNILANTNLISYKDDETGQHYILTLTEFSRYLMRELYHPDR